MVKKTVPKKKPRVIPRSAVEGHKKILGKPVIFRDAKEIVRPGIEFQRKKLCGGLVFNLGDACAYRCAYCYVPSQMLKVDKPYIDKFNQVHEPKCELGFQDLVIRRRKNETESALTLLAEQLDPGHPRRDEKLVIFTSSLVEIAADLDLLQETAAACSFILAKTNWDIRLLSKSPLLADLVRKNMVPKEYHRRLIFGFSTGTRDEGIAAAVECRAPGITQRLEALRWLQAEGLRTYGMLCPSLPQSESEYLTVARRLCDEIDVGKCEHVWAEVMNSRGKSIALTAAALAKKGYVNEAKRLELCDDDDEAWERYARATFLALKECVPAGKLRFLQYPSLETLEWWKSEVPFGAILLGEAVAGTPLEEPTEVAAETVSEMPLALTLEDREKLREWESEVTAGLAASVRAARAIFEIANYKDGLLWRSEFDTFEEYCLARWDYKKAHSYRLSHAGEFIVALEQQAKAASQSPIGDCSEESWLPRNEAQIRPLMVLPLKDRVQVWQTLVGNKKPVELTAVLVAEATQSYIEEKKIVIERKKPVVPTQKRAIAALAKFGAAINGLPRSRQIRTLIEEIEQLL